MVSTCDHEYEAARGANPERPLTHLLDLSERGLAVKATRTCSVDGCERPFVARGWCNTHYRRWQQHGDVSVVRPLREPVSRPCLAGCGVEVPTSARSRGRLCADCRAASRRDISARYRERRKASGADRPFLREQHGMTEADYAAMLAAQGGKCAGCGRTPPIAGKTLHIDHDHGCCPQGGRSCARCRRGLLCAECNMALGLLRDNPETLETLAAYVRQYRGEVS